VKKNEKDRSQETASMVPTTTKPYVKGTSPQDGNHNIGVGHHSHDLIFHLGFNFLISPSNSASSSTSTNSRDRTATEFMGSKSTNAHDQIKCWSGR
jgi:hypothetical protein